MKVLHVIPSLSPKQGGPSFAMPLIARSLIQARVQVDVATTDDDGPNCRLNVPFNQRIERDGYGVFYFRKQMEFYKVSLSFKRWFEEHAKDYDIIHIHAVFSFTSNCAARVARRKNIPYIIRPLGVLNRWGMENRRRWLKSLSFRWIERPFLNHAAAMHYTSEAERAEAEAAGVCSPAAVIPLGIDMTEFQSLPDPQRFSERWPQVRGRKIILFLSRLNPKKGLDLLLEAFALNRKSSDWLLVVAGNGEASYERSLQEKASRLGLDDDILWTGFLAGEEKLSALAAAQLFVLPSHSENFGIVVVEALAAGLPCIITRGTPWADVETRRCGWWIDLTGEALARALRQAIDLSEQERQEMGKRGKELVAEKYSWPAVAERVKSYYFQVLEQNSKPGCLD